MNNLSDIGKPVDVCNHAFKWTPDHLTVDETTKLLYSYDKLATEALDRLDEISPPPPKSAGCPHGTGKGQRDLYALIGEHADADETIGKLWKEISTVPDWVDWDQIERGLRVVYQYNGQIALGLMFRSLVGGMGAGRVVETLARTGGFGVNVCRRRLLETLQHYMDVVEDLDAIKPGGKGYISTVRVRLLHATVRRRLMGLERQKPGYFDMKTLGVPINDLHQIGTISVYSASIAFNTLPRQGVRLSEQQTADYISLWRYVGYLLGTPVDWMATTTKAKAMMESIMVAEIHPTESSRILANNILTAETRVPPLNASREFLAAHTYRLNGDELAGALGIEKPGIYYRMLVMLQITFFLYLSWTYPLLPTNFRRRRDQKYRDFGREMILSQKMGGIGEATKFEFQYEPGLGKTTEMGQVTNTKSYATAILVVGMLLASVAITSVLHLKGELQAMPEHIIQTIMAQKQALESLR